MPGTPNRCVRKVGRRKVVGPARGVGLAAEGELVRPKGNRRSAHSAHSPALVCLNSKPPAMRWGEDRRRAKPAQVAGLGYLAQEVRGGGGLTYHATRELLRGH